MSRARSPEPGSPARERLQKMLARAGAAPSRRQAEELIRAGRVTVNGTIAELGCQIDPKIDSVKLDGKRIRAHLADFRYLLLNKPGGVVSTTSDPEGRPTVLSLVPPALRKALVPVGRLDFQTEGLLLLTNDGELAHRVAHPRYGCEKRYEVKVRGRPDEKNLERLRNGISIDGRRTAPCEIKSRRVPSGGREGSAGNSWWTVILNEGRTRQIREMFKRIGHPVQRLRRAAIGPITSSGLPPGDVRELTDAEVDSLRRSTGQSVPKAPRKRSGSKPPGKKPRGGSRGAPTTGRKRR